MNFDYKTRDYSDVYRERIERLKRIRSSDEIRLNAIAYYKENVVDYFNDWLVTYDPRVKPAYMPFILFPKQAEYLLWLRERWENKEDGLVEKSRDMGITYLNMGFALWLWSFWPGSKIGFGSRKEQLVDRIGDPDSIFEKGRIMLRNLPDELKPKGFDEEEHLNYLKIVNPDNGNSITGEAGDNIGRGGRNTIYFKDESAFYERPDKIEAALSQNSDVKIDVSTPNGVGNPFHRKRMSGKIKIFTFHWRDDPRKDQKWYEGQKDKLDPMILAQEVDIDYETSAEQVIIPARWVKAAVNFKMPDDGPKVGGLDVADEGPDSNAFAWRKGSVVKSVEAWKEGDTTQTTRKAVDICERNEIPKFYYESSGVGAGVKGEARSLKEFKKKNIMVLGLNMGGDPTSGEYKPGKKNKDMFKNLKIQIWWEVRDRFFNTFKYVNGDHSIDLAKCISIPARPQLELELSQQKYKFTPNGLLICESKQDMKSRGIKSPNEADSVIICFARRTDLDYRVLTEL